MKTETEILEMGTRFSIELPHMQQVACLATELFDGFCAGLKLLKEDRALLQAAAWLHDIGYAENPANHVETGVQILLEHPVSGFSAKEWRNVAGIVLLHRRDWRAQLDHPLFSAFGHHRIERVMKMGAILRIADGLDHGHIQDAKIVSCKSGKKTDHIDVRSSWYAGNVPWAQGKADLWESVFKHTLCVTGEVKATKQVFKGVVHKKDSAVAAARRILYSQYDIMRDQVPGMLEGSDLECLHEYRVALRRFRAAIKLVRPLLQGSGFQDVDRRLRELSDRIGPARDAHVLLQGFESLQLDDDAFPDWHALLKKEIHEANQKAAAILQSDACLQTVDLLGRFLRAELPLLERTGSVKFARVAEQRLYKILKRIRKLDTQAIRSGGELMHTARKLFRRGRYYAEFAAPVLGKKARRTAKTLKTITGSLGDVRDAQMHLQKLQHAGGHAQLEHLFGQQEDIAWDSFSKGWRTLIKT